MIPRKAVLSMRNEMTDDEKIQIERMREWNDSWGGPAPLCDPSERKEERSKHAVLPSIWKIEGSERPVEGNKKETWRDRPPML